MVALFQLCLKALFGLSCCFRKFGRPQVAPYIYLHPNFYSNYLFRDAKQHLGLADCQSTKQECLGFHFNAVMMTLNLARQESYAKANKVFSLQDIKTRSFNEKCLENIINNLDLDLNTIKLHPNYHKIIRKGLVAS